MDATVYSYKMTFKTLTFRDNPRFQDGLYIMVTTELAEHEINRTLYGPLTEDVIHRFREGYIQAAQQMLEAAAILLPRPAHLPDPLPFEGKAPINNPWGIDTTGWTPKDKDTLAMWANARIPHAPAPEHWFHDANDQWWRYSPHKDTEIWGVGHTEGKGWFWYIQNRASRQITFTCETLWGTREAAIQDCEQQNGDSLTDSPT